MQTDINDNTANAFYSKLDYVDKIPYRMTDIHPDLILTMDGRFKTVELTEMAECGVTKTPITTEEEPIEPTITEQEYLVKTCDGCLYGGNCIPYGIRLEGKYCSITKELISQKVSDISCENNYECQSNICISNQCVDDTLLNKILNWFKKLFS